MPVKAEKKNGASAPEAPSSPLFPGQWKQLDSPLAGDTPTHSGVKRLAPPGFERAETNAAPLPTLSTAPVSAASLATPPLRSPFSALSSGVKLTPGAPLDTIAPLSFKSAPVSGTAFGLTPPIFCNPFNQFLHNFLTQIELAEEWFFILAGAGMTEKNMRLLARFDEARRDVLVAKVVPTMKVLDRAILADAIRRLAAF